MTTDKALDVNPYVENPHVQFDAGEVISVAKPRRGSLLYKMHKTNVFQGGGQFMRCLLSLAISAAAGVVCAATTHYVVPAGTEGNTPISPYNSWATAANDLAMAIDSAAHHDTILVATGTYSIASMIRVTDSPTRRYNLKIESRNRETGEQDPEHTILDGGGTSAIMYVDELTVTIAGFTFANGYTNSTSYLATSASAALYFNKRQIGSDGSRSMTSNCIFRANKSVNVNGTCINKNATVKSPIIADCRFLNNTQEVTVASQPVRGSAIVLAVTTDAPEDEYGVISGCTFSGNFGRGPYAQGSTLDLTNGRTVVDGCNFYTNSFEQTETAQVTSGAYLRFGLKTTLKDSIVSCTGYDNAIGSSVYGSVMRTDNYFTCSNCTFRAIEENSGEKLYGTICVSGETNKFLDCRFVDNAIKTEAKSHGFFFFNKCGYGLFRNCLFSGNTRSSSYALFRTSDKSYAGATRFTVENCTFADNSDNVALMSLIEGATPYTCNLVNSVFTADNNKVLSASAANATLIASNCCFKAAFPNYVTDGGGNFTTADIAAMKFVDAANGNYHLQGRSPLREKGLLLPWMTADATDLDGNRRVYPSCPDIGCYECQVPLPGLALIIR